MQIGCGDVFHLKYSSAKALCPVASIWAFYFSTETKIKGDCRAELSAEELPPNLRAFRSHLFVFSAGPR